MTTCEVSGHDYTPYPRSRDLYCRLCGAMVTSSKANAPEVRGPSPSIWPRDLAGEEAYSPDPNVDDAKDIIADSAREKWIAELNALYEEFGIYDQYRAALLADAKDVGPELDMNAYRILVHEYSKTIPVETGDLGFVDEMIDEQ